MIRQLFACAALLVSGTVGAQVYRCESAGKVTYTDAPCHSGAVRAVQVDRNTVAPVKPAAAQAEAGPAGAGIAAPEPSPPGACPTETDIGNIRTRLSGRVIPARNRAALHAELAKAQRCPREGARYGYEDWKRLEGVLRGED